jgi:hypothetical protein
MPEPLDIERSSRMEKALKLYKEFVAEGSLIALANVHNPQSDDKHNAEVAALIAKYEKLTENDPGFLDLGRQAYENIVRHGASTWYDWSIQNWGTKWPAYQQNRIDDNTIEFLTAWSGATPIMERLSEQFPDIKMSHMYADEDWGRNVGEYKYEGGECIYENCPSAGSDEANHIAEELLGPYENEDDEEWEDEV